MCKRLVKKRRRQKGRYWKESLGYLSLNGGHCKYERE